MNYTPVYGWYYIDANQKAPAWTGVQYFYNFVTRMENTIGPIGANVGINEILPGDFVQLRFQADNFGHTPVIVEVGWPPSPENILVAAHSDDADWRPLSTYNVQEIRFIHIYGAIA